MSLCAGVRARRRCRTVGARATSGLTWISGATLLIVLLFSVYALERPPAFPDDPRTHAPISAFARYDFADVLTAVAR